MSYVSIERNERPELWAILKRALPDYRKRSFALVLTDSVTPLGTSWDGGSRSFYVVCNPDGSNPRPAKLGPNTGWPNFATPEPTAVTREQIVIQGGTFRGKTAPATLYLPTDQTRTGIPTPWEPVETEPYGC